MRSESNQLDTGEQIEALTSLRGIAAWWVVFYHFREALVMNGTDYGFLAEGGFLAVDLFFVLSGFVIFLNYRYLFEEITLSSLRKFFVRRLARVYPLHFLVLVIFLANPLFIKLFSSSGSIWQRYAWDYYLASILMIQNWGGFDYLAWNIPAWSISTEFGAYLLFPVLCYWANRVKYSQAVLIVALLLGAVFLVYNQGGQNSLGESVYHYGLARCCLEFCCGLFIARMRMLNSVSRHAAQFVFYLALFIVWIAIVGNFPDYCFVPFVAVLLVYFFSIKGTWQSNSFENPALIWFGTISYSTYLVHFLVKDWVKFASSQIGLLQFFIYIVIVLLLSILMYRFVEVPGRKLFLSICHD